MGDAERRHCDTDVDEAIAVIKSSKDPSGEVPITLDERPWWQGLRCPLYFIGVGVLLLAASVAILATLLLRADVQSSEQDARSACTQVLNAQVGQAAADSRFATSALLAALGYQLIEGDDIDEGPLVAALDTLTMANERDRQALAVRDSWLAEGRPLPCPVSIEDES